MCSFGYNRTKGLALFGIGGFELFLILLFGFLIFGPDKLPAIAKTIGQALAKFRSAQEEMNKVIKTEVYDPNSDEPFKNPLDALEKMGNVGKQATSKSSAKPAAKTTTAEKKTEEKQETFSERKARYEAERAAKKAAEAEAAKETGAAAAAAPAVKPAVEKAVAEATAAKAKPAAEPVAEAATEEKGE